MSAGFWIGIIVGQTVMNGTLAYLVGLSRADVRKLNKTLLAHDEILYHNAKLGRIAVPAKYQQKPEQVTDN